MNNTNEKGGMTVQEAGRKGGARERELVQEGKDLEMQERSSEELTNKSGDEEE